jgi:hypothetical protein
MFKPPSYEVFEEFKNKIEKIATFKNNKISGMPLDPPVDPMTGD